MTQKEFLSDLLKSNRDSIIVSSLGSISKDLSSIYLDNKNCDKNWIIPIRGAMGCILGTGLAIALNTKKKVIVLIGDGAFLMKMGSLATIMRYKPKNLKIIILNNNCHASCGGQPTNFKYIKKYIQFCKIVEIEPNEIHSG